MKPEIVISRKELKIQMLEEEIEGLRQEIEDLEEDRPREPTLVMGTEHGLIG